MRAVRLSRQLWEVQAVCDAQGRCVLLEELKDLDKSFAKNKLKILSFLRYSIAQQGPETLAPFRDRINDYLDEWKIGRFRIFFFGDGNRIVVCTSLYMKKTGRTPEHYITRALNLRAAYLAAKRNGALDVRNYNQEQDGP